MRITSTRGWKLVRFRRDPSRSDSDWILSILFLVSISWISFEGRKTPTHWTGLNRLNTIKVISPSRLSSSLQMSPHQSPAKNSVKNEYSIQNKKNQKDKKKIQRLAKTGISQSNDRSSRPKRTVWKSIRWDKKKSVCSVEIHPLSGAYLRSRCPVEINIE